ncbi:MAG: hypothetical protein NC452_05700 [Eubacterium sp.]|nr:hypothetical protein [Eubacterium sp.]
MTVSELIKTLSDLEEQDREVFVSGICIVPIETVEDFAYSLEKSGSPVRMGYLLVGNNELIKRGTNTEWARIIPPTLTK